MEERKNWEAIFSFKTKRKLLSLSYFSETSQENIHVCQKTLEILA